MYKSKCNKPCSEMRLSGEIEIETVFQLKKTSI